MAAQILSGALLWLTLSGTLAVNLVYKDNVSAQSVKQVYRWPVGVYASAAPYGAYSVQVPLVVAPKASASSPHPAKETLLYNNPNGYFKQTNGFLNLKDSYGNRYVQSPHSVPLKPSFPQQFLKLQELPAHFAQPLSAAPLSYSHYNSYKQPSASPQGQVVYGSHYKLPVQSAAPSAHKHYSFSQSHPSSFGDTIKSFAPQTILQSHLQPSVIQIPAGYTAGLTLQRTPTDELPHAQQHSTGSEAIYSSTQTPKLYHVSTHEPHYQPVQHDSEEIYDEEKRKAVHTVKQKLKKNPVRETHVKTVVNGQKTVVNLKTKPAVPLLDISLLEPLTFKNPLVPQVQHFLPRIKDATYHKLSELDLDDNKKYHKDYVVHKTKTYDSGVVKGKPKKKHSSKRKHKHENPSIKVYTTYGDEISEASTARPTIVDNGHINESPEIIYEINGPNFKETIKEKAISYNKETNSEPVHYQYGTTNHKEPVHYTYIHSSKEPIHIKEVRYEGHGEGPGDDAKPQHENKDDESESDESDESDDTNEESGEDDGPQIINHKEHEYHHESHPKQHKGEYHQEHHHESKPKQHQGHHNQHHNYEQHQGQRQVHHSQQNNYESKPKQHEEHHQHYHHESRPKQSQGEHHQQSTAQHNGQQHGQSPTPHVYQTSYHPVAQYEQEIQIAAPIQVNPSQHIQPPRPEPRSQAMPQFKPIPVPQQKHHNPPAVHVKEKTKQVIIHEETPEDTPSEAHHDKEEDKEKDFERAYKNAAFGFPAYDSPSDNAEKDIFNPESYGVPRDHSSYNINSSPFQQYQEHGDPFPKTTRLSYVDARDKTKEDYFLDYSIKKPESLTDQYNKKTDYYKLYKQHSKPEKEEKKSEKYSAIPYNYYPMLDQMSKQVFAQYKAVPLFQEIDYSKRDNAAYSSRPFHTYKLNTQFVEPQFQYGLEATGLPRLLDSELAAMATNQQPHTDNPGHRKKLYKENFYIKTTNTEDAGPNS